MVRLFSGFSQDRYPFNRPLPFAGLSVLVADESRYCGEAACLLANRTGMRVSRVLKARNASVIETSLQPEIAIVNLSMPADAGFRIVSKLAHKNRPPAIIATGRSGNAELAMRAALAGADFFLPRPVMDLALFSTAVHQVLSKRLKLPRFRPCLVGQTVRPDKAGLLADLRRIRSILTSGTRRYKPVWHLYCADLLTSLALLAGQTAIARSADTIRSSLEPDFKGGKGRGDERVRALLALVASCELLADKPENARKRPTG